MTLLRSNFITFIQTVLDMKIFLRILKWLAITFGVFLLVALLYLHFGSFSVSEEEISEAFEGFNYHYELHTFTVEEREIFYVAIGDTSKTKVLFVHGSPGSWDNFISFMRDPELLKDFRLLSVDRPGFGESGYGVPERSVKKQAALIAEVLYREPSSTPTMLVGHSYGGAVVARLAMDFPELVDGLVFVAASLDPDLEQTKWYQIPVHYKVLSWILPGILYSTNEEILALKTELELMKPFWKDITVTSSIIQGKSDKLVPYPNALYADSMLINSKSEVILIDDLNHFIPWNRPQLIRQALYSLQSNIDIE